jgi:hypothetical protein
MSCNCKNSGLDTNLEINLEEKKNNFNILLNFITFLLILPLMLAVIIPATIYIMFKSIVLGDNKINVMSMLVKIGKNTLTKEDEDYETEEEYNEEELEYELTDFDYVNTKKQK